MGSNAERGPSRWSNLDSWTVSAESVVMRRVGLIRSRRPLHNVASPKGADERHLWGSLDGDVVARTEPSDLESGSAFVLLSAANSRLTINSKELMPVVDCQRCRGRGYKPGDPEPTGPGRWCLACAGDGKVDVIDPSLRCKRCNGDGSHSDTHPDHPKVRNWCAGCRGTGYPS